MAIAVLKVPLEVLDIKVFVEKIQQVSKRLLISGYYRGLLPVRLVRFGFDKLNLKSV